MTPLAEAQATAERLLEEHGAWSPLELLLATNRLPYDDYRAWRRGERATLDETLHGGTQDTSSLMAALAKWARSLELTAHTVALYGIDDNAGSELTASADVHLDGLLHTEFQPAASRAQLDLFLDSSEAIAVGELAAALAMRDADTADRRLARLVRLNAQHWAVPDAQSLVDALRAAPPATQEAAIERLDVLERRWRPAACAVLHADARDFLAPLWRDAGAALSGALFVPEQPRRHASWAYLNGLDWANAAASAETALAQTWHPDLAARLAEALWRQRRQAAARKQWFSLCWRAPDRLEWLIDQPRFPDAMLRQAWQAAKEADLEPPLTVAWLPAWMALEGAAAGCTASGGDSAPQQAFDLLLSLAAGGSDRQVIDDRRALQELHPGLLARYLATSEG